MEILNKMLAKLDIHPSAREVYVDLVENGASPARFIAARLSMTRPSVYDQLKELIQYGLVIEKEIDNKTVFAVGDIADLGRLIDEEKKGLERLQKEFGNIRETLRKKTKTTEPKIKFITSREGILRSMLNMLWDETLTLRVVWPYEEMLRMLGEKLLVEFNEKRIRNRIRIQSIWTDSHKKNERSIWEGGDIGVERRFAPKSFQPRMAYTVYGNKVLFVSSSQETFGFVVQSEDIAELMSLQFELLWNVSKEKEKGRR